jgi:hypothetical protein
MVNAFGRLPTLATAVVSWKQIFSSAAYLHSPPIQSESQSESRAWLRPITFEMAENDALLSLLPWASGISIVP